MLSSRGRLSDLLHIRLFHFSRVKHFKSSCPSLSSGREHDYQSGSSLHHIAYRSLCTNVNHDYSEVLNKSISTKFNLTKQIIIRGKAATSYQEELINNFLASHETATPEEWHELITKVFNLEFGMINEINVDGKIVDSCALLSKLDLARSYLAYMKSQKKKFNGAVVTAFIKVCYACKDFMTEQDKTRMKQFTAFLQKRYAVADTIICEGIVKGLILQGLLDEALDTIVKNEAMCTLNRSTYSAAATYLLGTKQFDRALSFVHESLRKVAELTDEVYLKWVEAFQDDKEKLEKLLEVFRLFDIKPTKLVCDHVLVAFQSLQNGSNSIGAYGTIDSSGKCSVCKKMLNHLELGKEEFDELRVNFLNNVLVGDDVFKNTTPQELDKFFKLVKSEAPFDVVIDGLNVAYMIGTKTSPTTFVNMIQHVVNHFREQEMKVLLIGRQHMKRWPNLTSILQEAQCYHFLINDLSEDDPFMLYATMYSGIHTNFVTRDLLRTEKFLLHSDKYSTLFKRWQQAHQIFISYVSPSGRVYAKSPLNFQMSVQRSKNGWHIPYAETSNSSDEYGIHKEWLCLH